MMCFVSMTQSNIFHRLSSKDIANLVNSLFPHRVTFMRRRRDGKRHCRQSSCLVRRGGAGMFECSSWAFVPRRPISPQ